MKDMMKIKENLLQKCDLYRYTVVASFITHYSFLSTAQFTRSPKLESEFVTTDLGRGRISANHVKG